MAFRLFVLACCCAFAGAQMQQGFGANGQQAPQPLEATLMQVFDKDFDGKVTLSLPPNLIIPRFCSITLFKTQTLSSSPGWLVSTGLSLEPPQAW